MPAVVVAFAAVGVALLMLLVAYALTVLFTPLIEGVLRQVPLAGAFLADKVAAAGDYAEKKIVSYVNTGVGTLTSWFHGLADSTRSFVAAVNGYLVELPGVLDHLTHVTVPALIHEAVKPVRELVAGVEHDATEALHGIDAIATLPLTHFRGIEHGVKDLVDSLRDTVKNVDLPSLENTLDREIQRARDAAAAGITDTQTLVDQGFGEVWDFLGKIPLTQLLPLIAAVPALGLIVNAIASEAGLDNAECRGKVKQICATDLGAWTALLDVAGIVAAWVGFDEMVKLMQDFARELVPAIEDLVHGG